MCVLTRPGPDPSLLGCRNPAYLKSGSRGPSPLERHEAGWTERQVNPLSSLNVFLLGENLWGLRSGLVHRVASLC